MKRTICLFAAVAAIFAVMVSCGKEKLGNVSENTAKETVDYSDDPMRVITVTIPKGDTKMAFEENAGKLRRSFSESDIDQCFIGCTKVEGTYKSFAYQITSVEDVVDATTIKLSKVVGEQGVPSDAAGTVVNFVYAPGHDSVDESGNLTSFDGNKLNLDLSNQTEGAIPAVMFASGTVENHSVTLNFKNIAAVLEIKDYSMSSDAEDWTSFGSVTVDALTKGTLTIKDDGTYELGTCEAGKAAIAVSEEREKGAPVFVAMLPGSNVDIKARFNDVVAGNEKIGNFDWAPASKVNVSENGFVRIKEKTFDFAPAAKIGEQKFGYVSKAFAAANEISGTSIIQMVDDCNDGVCELATGKTATLDLNGKTLFGSINIKGSLTINDTPSNGKISNSSTCVNVLANGSLILNGGCIETDSEEVAAVYVNKEAAEGATTAIFNGGQIIQLGETSAGALYSKSSTVTFPDGSTTIVRAPRGRAFYDGTGTILSIKGGYIESGKSYPIFLNSGSTSTVEISGGTFVGVTHCLYMWGTSTKVNVTGGKFDWGETSNFCALNSSAKATQVTVSGGYLTREPYTANFTIQEGYGVKELDEPYEGKYYYTISNNPDPVAKVKFKDDSEEDYITLDEALTEVLKANDTATITLYKDCEVRTKCDLTGNVRLTIDLNGCKLTVTSTSRINIAADSQNTVLSVRDDSEEKTGTLYQKGEGDTYAMNIASGTFNLFSGCVDAAKARGGIRSQGGTINIYGGTVTGAVDYGTVYCSNASGSINIYDGTIASGVTDTLSGAVRLSAGTLTVSGGTITGAGKGALNMTGGTASISGGTFTTASYNNYDYRVCTIKNATVTMTGGTMGSYLVIGSDKYIYRAVYVDAGATFNLNGGNLYGRRSIFYCNSTAKVNMESGTIRTGANGSSYNTFAFSSSSKANVQISGGNVYTYGSSSNTFGAIPETATVTLTGGNYTKQPSSYSGVTIPEGYEEQSTTDTYSYKIVKK